MVWTGRHGLLERERERAHEVDCEIVGGNKSPLEQAQSPRELSKGADSSVRQVL